MANINTAKMPHALVCNLINAVRKRRKLWVKESGAKREYINLLWYDVSRETKLPVDICRIKWGHLRDNFRKTFIRNKMSPANPTSWKFYDEMIFMEEHLADSILKKRTRTDLESTKSVYNDQDVSQASNGRDSYSEASYSEQPSTKRIKIEIQDNDRDENETNVHREQDYYSVSEWMQPEINVGEQNTPLSTGQYPNSQHYSNLQLLNPFPTPTSSQETIDDTESNRFFLLSLLPYLNRTSFERNLRVRQKILSVLVEDMESIQ